MNHLIKLVGKAFRPPKRAVYSLLQELDSLLGLSLSHDQDENDTYQQIQILKVELGFLKTFLIYVGNWKDPDEESVGGGLRSVVQDLEAAFMEATTDFRAAFEKRIGTRAEDLDLAISKWQQKLKFFRPRIKAAYDYVLSNIDQSPHHFPLSNYIIWDAFSYSLSNNLEGLSCGNGMLLEDVKPHLCVMDEMIRFIRNLFWIIENQSLKQLEYRDLLTHYGAVLVRAAHICYVCWADSMDENMTQEMIIVLVDLLKKLKPNTPPVTDMCLNLLKALSENGSENGEFSKGYWVKKFVQFLVPEKDQLRTLQKGLEYLIMLVIRPPKFYKDDDVDLLLMDIAAVVGELGSLSYLFHAKEAIAGVAKDYTLLFKLLEKIELLNAELFLVELLEPGIREQPFVKDRINSFHDGLSFLQIILGDGNNKISQPIWTNCGFLARDAGYFYLSFLANSVTEENATVELLKLLEKIKLFKMEIILQELLNSYPSSMANVKNQIETLHKGLTVLRTFLLGPLEENGKLILAQVETVVRHVVSVFCSFRAKKVTEDNARSIVLLLAELIERIGPVNAEIKNIYLRARGSLKSNFPKIDEFGFMDFLLGKLTQLLNSKAYSIGSLKYPIQVVHGEIGLLRSVLWDIGEQWTQNLDLRSLVLHIIEVAYEAEYLVDSFMVRGGFLWYHPLWAFDLIEDIKLVKMKASEISMKTRGISIRNGPAASRKVISPKKFAKIDEFIIDLPEQTRNVIDGLTRGSLQQDVVSIVGIPGLGKTTLAKKVYNDPSVTFHFHIQAWCSVSPVYRKRDLLLEILGDIMDITDNILEMSDDDLDLELYQRLKRKRYIIVMDDMWSTDAWHDLKTTFPNDENGSRILITSRHLDVALKIQRDSAPHPLRLLTDNESWELLRENLFRTKDCPVELMTVGEQIAKSCNGLPLAVVAISGLLERTEMTADWWKQVSESLSSRIANDPQTSCMDILELSYKHLPDYLKPCFLYLGAFLENKEIPIRKLTSLWIAEGFIRNTGLKSAEDLAEEYLRDLTGRSLVIACKSRSDGGVKTCRVHDILRTLCLLRCKEERFLEPIVGNDEAFASSNDDSDYGIDSGYNYPANCTTYESRRLSIYSKRNHFVMSRPSGPHVRSLLYSASSDVYPRCPYNISFISENCKLLRVLDLECINMGNSFPSGIELLTHLRYLALCGDIDCIPESIANLCNLETFIVKGLKGKVLLPDTIWSMEKLRHVHVYSNATFSMQDSETEDASQLQNLVSFSSPSFPCGKDTGNILRRLPKLRKLRCLFSESRVDAGNSNQFPVLDFLTELESLKVLFSGRISRLCKFDFPLQLKKLTLSKFRLPWDCISEVGKLPNLEILKLLSRAFEGKVWDLKEGEFQKLRYLKLNTLNVAQWNASSDNFPNLQHLVLRNCRQLEEVPSGFSDIYTLEIIEVQFCRQSAEESVRRLKEEHHELALWKGKGGPLFKIKTMEALENVVRNLNNLISESSEV